MGGEEAKRCEEREEGGTAPEEGVRTLRSAGWNSRPFRRQLKAAPKVTLSAVGAVRHPQDVAPSLPSSRSTGATRRGSAPGQSGAAEGEGQRVTGAGREATQALAHVGAVRPWGNLMCDIGGMLASGGGATGASAASRGPSRTLGGPVDEARLAETFARLSTPRARSVREDTGRLKVSKEFRAYAQQAALDMLPPGTASTTVCRGGDGAAPFTDIWRTAGEDGYRSAAFHTAVRCKELAQSIGADVLEFVIAPDGSEQVAFKGSGDGQSPELARLHTACFLYDELCRVSSPLQDTLKFLFREFCQCIFSGYRVGCDVLLLTPFFATADRATASLNELRARAEGAERAAAKRAVDAERLRGDLKHLQGAIKRERELSKEQAASFESLLAERNVLRVKVARMQEKENIISSELVDLNSQASKLQGSEFIARRDLDQSRKENSAMVVQMKEKELLTEGLHRKIDTLLRALLVANDDVAADFADAHDPHPPVELTPEVEAVLAHLRKEGTKKLSISHTLSDERQRVGADGKRILKLPHNGSWQLIVKGCSDEEGGEMKTASKEQPPMRLVSPEVFAALSISLALARTPDSPDLLRLAVTDVDGLVWEVQNEVLALALEHRALLEVFRKLRQDLKKTIKLIPEWNADELRGLLQSVLVFDAEESLLVPLPFVAHISFVGLGETSNVPSFLRYVGTLPMQHMSSDSVKRTCHEVWLAKTRNLLEANEESMPILSLSDFMNEYYLPKIGPDRHSQMEFCYSFLHALRLQTTLMESEENATGEAAAATGSGAGASTVHFQPSCHFLAGAEVLYRGLRGELHEDAYHDQTAMILALVCRLVSLNQQLTPAHYKLPRSSQLGGADIPVVYGLAELSAVLRLFFPSKPREHLSAIKQIIVAYTKEEEIVEVPQALAPSESEAAPSDRLSITSKTSTVHSTKRRKGSKKKESGIREIVSDAAGLGEHKDEFVVKVSPSAAPAVPRKSTEPPLVDIGRVLGVELHRDGIQDRENFLAELIGHPSPLVIELRRQYMAECFMFLDRLHKAFRVMNGKSAAGAADAGEGENEMLITAKQADAALVAADQHLSEDQRCVYVLRGFGKRLPDLPSAEAPEEREAAAEASLSRSATALARKSVAHSQASRVRKLGLLLKERVQKQLVDASAVVPADVFVKRLANTGVTKSARQWNPDFTAADVVNETGLANMRGLTATLPLESFLHSDGAEGMHRTSASGTTEMSSLTRGVTSNDTRHMSTMGCLRPDRVSEASPFFGDITEFSVGYPVLSLSYWASYDL